MKKFLSAVICLGLLLSLCSPMAEAAPQGAGVTTVIACSDFQNDAGNEAGKTVVRGILDAMGRAGITSADGFLCCGDYDIDHWDGKGPIKDTQDGVEALTDAVSGVVTENLVFAQGNHDTAIGTAGMSPSGKNDPASGAYGVFVINEDDYMWAIDMNEARIKRTAQNLKAYLNEKRTAQFDKPVFVLSHLPLHYSMRTHGEGDGMYAKYIFDVLNEAGEAGLNIFFLFGHDHSNGWDDYLGGSCVYLAKEDKILISQGSKENYEMKTLKFTYLNAGYVGYYRNVNGADDALTMTVFQISDSQVTVARYAADGRHALKSEGVRNNFKGEGNITNPYTPNATQYASPQTVTLTKKITPPPEPSHEGACYTRVTDLSQLTDGGGYVLECRPYTLEDCYLMLPTVVTKDSRTGFDLGPADGVGDATIYGDYTGKEWTFTQSGTQWLIGDGTQNAKLTGVSASSASADLEAAGELMTITAIEDGGVYAIGNGTYFFNYNTRGLVNGYNKDPARFYIYKFTGYDVVVEGGTASPAVAAPGASVSVTANAAPDGQVFDKWVVVEGGVTLGNEDRKSPSITITMPAKAVKLRATYRSAAGPDDPVPTPPCATHSYGSWEVVLSPTCTEAGLNRRKCVVCGSMNRERVAPLGHEYSSTWTTDVPATETTAGVRSHHCIRCSARTDVTEIPMTAPLPYRDVAEGSSDYTAIQYVVGHKLFYGVSATQFAPDMMMSRGMLATVLWRMDGRPAAGEHNPYTDVAPGLYYTDAVLWAWEDGIFGNTDSLEFVPGGKVTREQLAVVLYQYSQSKGYDTAKRADLASFPDSESISDFAREALAWAVAEELIMGMDQDGLHMLAPQDGATRAQVAVTFMRYQKNVMGRQNPVQSKG